MYVARVDVEASQAQEQYRLEPDETQTWLIPAIAKDSIMDALTGVKPLDPGDARKLLDLLTTRPDDDGRLVVSGDALSVIAEQTLVRLAVMLPDHRPAARDMALSIGSCVMDEAVDTILLDFSDPFHNPDL